jgi:outer membrane protein assembly factor BamD (BamD/ComL family)
LLLQRSQAALDHNARLALSVAETHARDYPRGVFEQEREILAIEALLKLRRAPEAVARARAFVQHHPESPHTPRVRALLDRSKYQELPTTKPPTDHSREQQLLGGPHDYE